MDSQPLSPLQRPVAVCPRYVASETTLLRVQRTSRTVGRGFVVFQAKPELVSAAEGSLRRTTFFPSSRDDTKWDEVFTADGSLLSPTGERKWHAKRDTGEEPLFRVYRKLTGVTFFLER